MTTEDRAQRLRTLWRERRHLICRNLQETGTAKVTDQLRDDPLVLVSPAAIHGPVMAEVPIVTFTVERRGRVTAVVAEGITVEAHTL